MDLGFGQMMAVVGALHAGVDVKVIRARLKYFQRITFPASEDVFVGTGERARYDAETLMKLLLAFELLAAGVAPQQAATLVNDGWEEPASTALARGWAGRDDRGDYVPTLLTVRVVGLESKRAGSGRLEVAGELRLRIWLNARDKDDRRLLLVETVQLALALRSALGKELMLSPAIKMQSALDAWSEARLARGRHAYGT